MKTISRAIIITGCLTLGACWTSGDDQAAENVSQNFEKAADRIDAAADNASGEEEERLEKTADVVRDTGEAAAESVDDHDLTENKQ
jgi:predicted ArsR family transcriptional regulator